MKDKKVVILIVIGALVLFTIFGSVVALAVVGIVKTTKMAGQKNKIVEAYIKEKYNITCNINSNEFNISGNSSTKGKYVYEFKCVDQNNKEYTFSYQASEDLSADTVNNIKLETNTDILNNTSITGDKNVYIKYIDGYIPPVTYTLVLNDTTAKLEAYHSCSAVDCEGDKYTYNLNLTAEEQAKIYEILNKLKIKYNMVPKTGYLVYIDNVDFTISDPNFSFGGTDGAKFIKYLLSAIESIAKGEESMGTTTTDNFLIEYDLNNDKKVTRKEFGDSYLNDILEDLNQ